MRFYLTFMLAAFLPMAAFAQPTVQAPIARQDPSAAAKIEALVQDWQGAQITTGHVLSSTQNVIDELQRAQMRIRQLEAQLAKTAPATSEEKEQSAP